MDTLLPDGLLSYLPMLFENMLLNVYSSATCKYSILLLFYNLCESGRPWKSVSLPDPITLADSRDNMDGWKRSLGMMWAWGCLMPAGMCLLCCCSTMPEGVAARVLISSAWFTQVWCLRSLLLCLQVGQSLSVETIVRLEWLTTGRYKCVVRFWQWS